MRPSVVAGTGPLIALARVRSSCTPDRVSCRAMPPRILLIRHTGPLIALARIGQLDLLRRLYARVRVPTAVYAELALASGRPGANVLAGAFEAGWIDVQPAMNADVVSELSRLLDPGEAEAIVLALQERTRFLLIDDARGRAVARRRGVAVVGVAGALLAAKASGALAAVGPQLEELSRVGYRLSGELVAAVLERAGE